MEFRFEPVAGRSCGSCTLCCHLVPVAELQKPANEWCRHCAPKHGCRIYQRRPSSCRFWSCRWLTDERIPEWAKPDRTHVVFDATPDGIIVGDQPMMVAQLWVDPAHPDAYKHPWVIATINYLATEYGIATLVRHGNETGTVAVAPILASDGEWHFVESNNVQSREDFNTMLEEADGH